MLHLALVNAQREVLYLGHRLAVAGRASIGHHARAHLDDSMRLPKPAALVIALVSVTLLSRSAYALSQGIGGISCDVISDYGATSPAYYEVFQAFLEGFLAGE